MRSGFPKSISKRSELESLNSSNDEHSLLFSHKLLLSTEKGEPKAFSSSAAGLYCLRRPAHNLGLISLKDSTIKHTLLSLRRHPIKKA